MESGWLSIIILSQILSVVLCQVSVGPASFISVPGGNASFFCLSTNTPNDGISNVLWLLNDTLLQNLELGNNTETELINSGLGRLRISNIFQALNGSRIKCTVEFMSGRVETSNAASLLLIQGNVTVRSLEIAALNSTISLNWIAPVTLNLDPDITYCVDVVNSTSSSTLHSECGINVTEFSYPTPPDTDCHIYTFTVTPMIRIGNGEANSISYLGTETAPKITAAFRTLVSSTHSMMIEIFMSSPVCSGQLIKIVDVDTREAIKLDDINLTFTGNNTIIFFTTQLIVNRHYNVTVVASNVAGSATSYTTITTHDIFDAAIGSQNGSISTRYFVHSVARGALFIIVFITDDGGVDFTRSILLILDRSNSNNYTLPFSLSAGQYRVLVYDIEQDGTLPSGVSYPAVRDELLASQNSQDFSFQAHFNIIESCRINAAVHFIWAECNYTIAGGFQMTAQLRNSSQVHKLFNGKATSPQTSVAIAVEENGIYQVSIIGIRRGTGIVESEVEHVQMVVVNDTLSVTGTFIPVENTNIEAIISFGVGIGILALFIVILCGIIIALCYRLKFGKQHQTQILSEEKNTTVVIGPGENQLYAEIRDPEPSHSATQNVVTPPSVPAPRGPTSPYYEDVDVPKSGGDYQLTQCDAYGVHRVDT